MRLADDNRGRVPFALVGVLLLVTSSTYGASLATGGPSAADRTVDESMDRIDAETTTALRTAAHDAALAAARDPVTDNSTTAVGEVLGENRTFRRYLRLRISLAAAESLRSVEHERGDVVANASLPTPTSSACRAAGRCPATPKNESSVREAIRRVSVAKTANGTALRVTVRNVSLTARRDGRMVAEESVTRTLTVAVPVLGLHDRTVDYQRRLDANPLESPGLARRTTAGLLGVVQVRGAAQYAGAPIQNVLANRHVELSTNAGLLTAQRAAFGRSDPDARRGVRRATARTGLTDVLTPVAGSDGAAFIADGVTDAAAPPESENATIPTAAPPSTDETLRVDVGRTADEAFVKFLRGDGERAGFETIRRDGYRVRVTVQSDATTVRDGSRPAPDAPGEGWAMTGQETSRETRVESAGGTATRPRTDSGERVFDTAVRRVVVEHRVERTWRHANRSSRSTDATWTDAYRVEMAVTGSLASVPGPERPVDPLFERGGAVDGPNLRQVPDAVGDAFAERGGADAVARRAVGGEEPVVTTVDGRRPDELRAWVYDDVASLRERVRNVAVEPPARAVATGRVNPAARLASVIRERRASLVAAPDSYDGAADRVRVAARAAYLNRLLAALDERANRTAARNEGIEEALVDRGVDAERANRIAANRTVRTPARHEYGNDSTLGGSAAFVPDGDPAYLSVKPVSGDRVDGVGDETRYYPLAARNTNVFTLPYGDASDAVVNALFGSGESVSLRTAGKALTAANRTLATTDDETLAGRRDTLRRKTEDSLRAVRSRAVETLGAETDLPKDDRRRAVNAAFDRWEGTGRRAVAATNGSFAAAVAAEVEPTDATARDRLETALRVDVAAAATESAVRVPQRATNRTVSRTRKVGTKLLTDAAGRGTERAAQKYASLGGTPAGLPLSPTLNPWVATTNLWVVEARGEYARFAVSADRGGETPVTYVRDGSVVALDVDGDGVKETLGRSERVGFDVRTVVPVVVPPGRLGVGDKDGDAVEKSPAWDGTEPGPGCETPTGRCPRE
ncbi:DUF7286 family protein [Halopelagius longus]|uniref:Uncharacterized protein n=2 Tax=Halopelagius longus TaxID=1236180 RepID=A0A1H1D9V6_9EURY|nr:hypothetical protein [Halopelagius longus]RDI71228.1 hypothetical protein DWB78_05475 [Halopelagius longus]SDQ72969.1 hypothetical protein SAMN05216278_2292 [Halopelagius longus]